TAPTPTRPPRRAPPPPRTPAAHASDTDSYWTPSPYRHRAPQAYHTVGAVRLKNPTGALPSFTWGPIPLGEFSPSGYLAIFRLEPSVLIRRCASAVALFIAAGAAQAQSFSESFSDLSTLPGSGWVIINHSQPLGTNAWFQGNPSVFAAQSAPGYIAANVNST